MTVLELAEELGMNPRTVGSSMSNARVGKKKHFYIVDYRPQVGNSGLAAGIYAIGNRKDAVRPPPDKKAAGARYYQNHKATIKLKRGRRDINPFTALITQVTR
ncbi:hypothetical protein C7S13_3067 [Burkholderia cepacia]|nr:hypothetical protein [Burkholderia cepacia]